MGENKIILIALHEQESQALYAHLVAVTLLLVHVSKVTFHLREFLAST